MSSLNNSKRKDALDLFWIGKRNDQMVEFCQTAILDGGRAPYLFNLNGTTLSREDIIKHAFDLGFLERLVWYDERWPQTLNENKSLHRRTNMNPLRLLNFLASKHSVHQVNMGVPRLEGKIVRKEAVTYNKLRSEFSEYDAFIIHSEFGSACEGVRCLYSENEDFIIEELSDQHLLVTPLIRSSIPCNIHLLIGDEQIGTFPPSLQLLTPGTSGRLQYQGCDFSALAMIDKRSRRNIETFGRSVGKFLRSMGYRGICGVDFLLEKNDCRFVEVNARFQASTGILNKFLIGEMSETAQNLHLLAQNGCQLPSIPSNGASGALSIIKDPSGEGREMRVAHTGTIAKSPFGVFPQICRDISKNGDPI